MKRLLLLLTTSVVCQLSYAQATPELCQGAYFTEPQGKFFWGNTFLRPNKNGKSERSKSGIVFWKAANCKNASAPFLKADDSQSERNGWVYH